MSREIDKSRVLVASDMLVQLTDGTDADLAVLLAAIVVECPVADPWREVRIHLHPSWSRECVVRTARGEQFPALVEISSEGRWAAHTHGMVSLHDTPEDARTACDGRLRARRWRLL